MQRLTSARYRFGSYTRGDLRGDILYGIFSFAGIEAFLSPQFSAVKDGWLQRHKERLPEDKTAVYEKELPGLMTYAAEDENYFEAAAGKVMALRRKIFASFVREAFFRDAESAGLSIDKADIDQGEQLQKWMEPGKSALLLFQDPRYYPLLLKDIKEMQKKGVKLQMAVSQTEEGIFPLREWMEKLLPDESVSFLPCEGDLSRLDECDSSLIVYYGERGLTECRNLTVPAFIRCVPESLVGRAVAGQFLKTGLCGIYVPPEFDILPRVPLRRRTIASYRQYAYLAGCYGNSCYSMSDEDLYKAYPQAFFSIYDENHMDFPKGIAWPPIQETGDWYRDYCDARDEALGRALDEIPGVSRLGGWFSLTENEQKPVPWTFQGEAKGILVHGVLIDRAVDARVVISDNEAISPRTLAEQDGEEGMGLILNYLFFLTPRLAALYNRLREGRPKEQTNLRGGHLDYMLCRRNGKRAESFPLYRKACMALRKDGTFAFFHFRLGAGSCCVNGQSAAWGKEDVDPAVPGKIAVFTPYSTAFEGEHSKFTYTKEVGSGRVNLVIVQDQLICARDGDVLLPCMGVVLSLERKNGLAFLRACGFAPRENGYYQWEDQPSLTVQLSPPEGFTSQEWDGVQWAYGGGLTLISGGKSCFQDEATAKAHLQKEGWASPLSEQTQESDIGSMVRHPRTAIGLTRQGKLFALVFSGRSCVTAGADYREMCALTRKLVPDVQELMNVDGGGSSLLGITAGNRLIEYSWPSTSPGTVAGMARPIHSLLQIKLTK